MQLFSLAGGMLDKGWASRKTDDYGGSRRTGESRVHRLTASTTMPFWPVIAGSIILFIAWSLIPGVRHWRFRRSICQRRSAQSQWANAFPNAASTVEQVLMILCEVFEFNARYRYHFHPDDKVLDIYKGTTGPISDSLEMERLALELEKSFGVDVVPSFSANATLHDIVAAVLAKSGT
jgi:hypothetical protein